MSYEKILINTTPPDTLPAAVATVNQNLTAIEQTFNELIMGVYHYGCTALVGGGSGTLDGIDGAALSDGQKAIVFVGGNPSRVLTYTLDEDNGGVEAVPWIIAPDTNAGDKRWVLAGIIPRLWSSDAEPTVDDDETTGVQAGDPWRNGADLWICVSAAEGTAVWRKLFELGIEAGTAAEGDHEHTEYAVIEHETTHILGGDAEIDGDQIGISMVPVNYERTTTGEAPNVAHLTAHLAGLDDIAGELLAAWSGVYDLIEPFDDMYQDNLVTDAGLDPATVGLYDPAAHCVTPSFAESDATIDIDPMTTADIVRPDLKGTIAYWQRTSGYAGFFSTDAAGVTPVSITAAGTESSVEAGCLVVHPGGIVTITHVINDGDQADEVELDTDLADATAVTAIYAITMSGSSITLPQAMDPNGANNAGTNYSTADMTADNAPSPNVVSATSIYSASYPAWEGWNQSAVDEGDCWGSSAVPTDGSPQSLMIDLGSGNTLVINKYAIQARNYSGERGFPSAWKLQGSNNAAAEVGDAEEANGWTTLDARSGISDPGQGAWSTYYTFRNTTAYRKYRIRITARAGTAALVAIANMKLVVHSGLMANPAQVCVARTNAVTQAFLNKYTSIDSAAITQTLAGSSVLWHTRSWDGGSTWNVYKSAAWREIVRDNSGTWQYKDGADAWQNAAVNNVNHALKQACGIAANQWSEAEIEAMGTAAWQATGGWTTSLKTIDAAWGLAADGANLPSYDKDIITYDRAAHDIELITVSWEASFNNPVDAIVVLKLKLNEAITLDVDLKAYASMDNGTNYEQMTGLSVLAEGMGFTFVRAIRLGLTPRDDATMRLKVTSHNGKDLEVHQLALGVRF